jgi:hypothetical protein
LFECTLVADGLGNERGARFWILEGMGNVT